LKGKYLIACIIILTVFVIGISGMLKNRHLLEKRVPEPEQKEEVLTNVYILEASENGLLVLYDGQELLLNGVLDTSSPYVYLADIKLTDGRITEVRLKNSTVKGTVLAVYEDSIELEGYGIVPLAKDFRMYEDYEKPKEVDLSRLVVGNDDVEFVAGDGLICAGIIKAPPDMTKIRVAVHTTDYNGLYHEYVKVISDDNITMLKDDEEKHISAGEQIMISKEDLKVNERIVLKSDQGSGITVESIMRSQGHPTYGGILEIITREEGLILVNEIGLEEYLCSVVPSEMPSSYHIEALKAQAVCARSYAWNQIQEGRFQAYGAHVDDSVGCQVYNNISRQESTTNAVYETAGEVAVHDEKVITAFYFSTSGGTTTTGAIWKNGEDISYLESKEVKDANGNDYEAEEPWYQWKVSFGGDDYWKGVKERAESIANIDNIGTLKDIKPGYRLDGGVLNSLKLIGSKETITIETENSVRKVLCENGAKIERNDGSIVKTGNLLPSAFIEFNLTYKDNKPDIIVIEGGGFGHGAGMSQNGAHKMAVSGKSYKEILQFFYEDIIIEKKGGREI